MSYGTNAANDDEIKKLVKFMIDLRMELRLFIERYNDLVPEYPELLELYKKAFDEVEPKFNIIRKSLESKDFKNQLFEAGLVGNQLDLKLAVFHLAQKEARDSMKQFDSASPVDKGQKEEKRKWWQKIQGWVFEHGDTVLGSLAAAGVPGTEAVSEIKEVAEKLIKKFKKK